MLEYNKDYVVRVVKKESGFSIDFREPEESHISEPKVDIISKDIDKIRFTTSEVNFRLYISKSGITDTGSIVSYTKINDNVYECISPIYGDVFIWIESNSKSNVQLITIEEPIKLELPSFKIKSVVFDGIEISTNNTKLQNIFVSHDTSGTKSVQYTTLTDGTLYFKSPFEGNIAIWIEDNNNVLSDIQYRDVSFFKEDMDVIIPPVLPNPDNTLTMTTTPFDSLRDYGTYTIENVNPTTDKKKQFELLNTYDYILTSFQNNGYYGMSSTYHQEYIIGTGEGDGKIRPRGYKTNPKSNMYDFHLKFPEFELPNGRLFVVQGGTDNDDSMLKRGVSFAENSSDPNKSFFFFGDGWLQSVGIPTQLDMSLPEHRDWVKNVNVNDMIVVFKSVLKDRRGYVMYNFEWLKSWAYSGVEFDKLKTFLNAIGRDKNYLLSLWAEPRITVNSPENYIHFYSDLWYKYENDLINTDVDLHNLSLSNGIPLHVDVNGLYETMDICHTGFYQYGLPETSHSMLIETLLAKKIYPKQKHVLTFWNDIESVGTLNSRNEEFEFYGLKKTMQIKARASNALAQTRAAWMTALGDGVDMWEHIFWKETKDEWYREINPHFDPIRFPSQRLDVVNWLASGVWGVSQHKDIIDASTKWEWLVNPVQSLKNKGVMCAVKRSADGKEALLLAVNEFAERGGLVEYDLGGFKFTTHLTFTTIERYKL